MIKNTVKFYILRYKNKVSTKTVYDPKVFNTEIMTNEIIQIVEKNLSSNELENTYKDINKTIPFDINYNGLKIRTHIRANSKGGGTIFASSVGVDYVSFGTAIVPSTGAKVLGATGVVVGTNKFVSGIGKVFNAIYGREPNSTINPIKDGLLKINPTGDARDFYNALEIATEVGVGQLAPYAIGINKKDTVYGTEGYRNYLSGNSRLQFNQPKNPKYQPLRNEDQILNGGVYSGHALDRMQDRGIPISVVEETIKYGKKSSSYSGRIQYYDAKNNITVITEVNGKVVMTRVGK